MSESTNILQTGNPILRNISRNIETRELTGKPVQSLIKRMHKVLVGETDGVALAAPQIGENFRVFVLSPKLFEGDTALEPLVYINPVIIKKSRSRIVFDEGCLSVRNIYGKIERHGKVSVEAVDEKGKRFTRGGSGVLAEVFQHEIDHLDGILFTDSAEHLREISAEHAKD